MGTNCGISQKCKGNEVMQTKTIKPIIMRGPISVLRRATQSALRKEYANFGIEKAKQVFVDRCQALSVAENLGDCDKLWTYNVEGIGDKFYIAVFEKDERLGYL